ncbi:hypothetical protein AUEXF2481DRAFT_138247 [Aureobasidium subglaciale EXF-2481]|uniref:Uncharacterized protein n=1 Tax=Aureobasidium subglaciale (strain EXF-2481) TaxID=1043005 RepID=A0A074YWF1_AURSE|nr:uncharacterized protein AUEXF2481DRAFT_138247 [Aureobasidium subglaciale EXF-2481]KER00475.1 hypothetical protein AUEXF2481DRAFT_138247 [Aureobasidium subglaciale EXF-2481]
MSWCLSWVPGAGRYSMATRVGSSIALAVVVVAAAVVAVARCSLLAPAFLYFASLPVQSTEVKRPNYVLECARDAAAWLIDHKKHASITTSARSSSSRLQASRANINLTHLPYPDHTQPLQHILSHITHEEESL